MAKTKTAAELRAENKLLKRLGVAQAAAAIVNTIVRWGGSVLIARYAFLSIEALAGETTLASIGVNVLSDIRVSYALAWLLAGGGVAYGVRQRTLRRDTVSRIQERNRDLEAARDPKRSSSRLTLRGETQPEDRHL